MDKIIAKSEQLISSSVTAVFNAFVDPEVLKRFWLKDSSGPLSSGAVVKWDFMVPGAHETVTVTDYEQDNHIAFTWSDGITVDIRFEEREETATKVVVVATGFSGDEATEQAINATEGFTIVLCDLKCLLETGRSGNMVRDKATLIAETL